MGFVSASPCWAPCWALFAIGPSRGSRDGIARKSDSTTIIKNLPHWPLDELVGLSIRFRLAACTLCVVALPPSPVIARAVSTRVTVAYAKVLSGRWK